MKRKVLGKGLSALISDRSPDQQDRIQFIPVNHIETSPVQPRREFCEQGIKELSESIREQGIILPVVVRRHLDKFQMIAGERRWRAAQLAGLKQIPAIVKNVNDHTALEIALIENLQRKDLNPLEAAAGYRMLIDEYKLTQEELAVKVGKDRATIANTLRLLKLPEDIQNWLRDGQLTTGHAKALLSLKTQPQMLLYAKLCIRNSWSVRALEKHVHQLSKSNTKEAQTTDSLDPVLESAVDHLRRKFSTKVMLKVNKSGRGKIILEYYSDDDLARIIELLGGVG